MRSDALGLTDGRRWWVLVGASMASFIVALDLLVVTTALDTIRRDFDASATALQWTVTAYSVSFAALLLTGAALGDRFGRRKMMLLGLGGFAVASAAAAMADTVQTLVVARVLQGAAGAVILPIGLTLVTSAFPPHRRASAIGVLEGVSGLAVIAGPVLGGVIAQYATWEWIFWVNVPIALATIVLVAVVVDESRGDDDALDFVGLLLVSAAASGLIWGLVRGNDVGWASGEIVASIGGGLALGVAFVGWEQRTAQPMLPMRLFSSRSFSVGATAAFLLAASLYVSVFFMAQFLQIALGHDSLGAGLRLLPWTATLFVTAPLAGHVADRVGHRPVLAIGLGLQALGIGWLALIAEAEMSFVRMVPPLIVAGVGTSAALPVSQAAVVGSVTDGEIGKAAGANNMLQELGGAFGIAAAVAMFASAGSYASPAAFADGFRAAMAVAAGFAAVGFLASLALPGSVSASTPGNEQRFAAATAAR